MSLGILVDMNFTPEWVPFFQNEGWKARHWSSIGDPRADDSEIMNWATNNGYLIFTRDLDFSTTLALTQASGPSVFQVREQASLPEQIGPEVIAALRAYENELNAGALVVLERSNHRIRVLPL